MTAMGLAATVVGAALALAAAPAGADLRIATRATKTRPVTWVDEDGRQLVVTSTAVGDGSSATSHLVVARTTPAGTPDAAWGSFNGHEGTRELVIAPPAPDAQREDLVAVDATGRITTTWTAPDCAAAGEGCDRWFVVVDATGATLATTATESDHRPIRALPDGSVLTAAPDGELGWWGPDGTDRGALGTADQPNAARATVDGAGRLVLSVDGTVTRRSVGGGIELTVDTSWCPSPASATPGPAAGDDGFALVCATGAGPVEVVRYDDTGAATWQTEVAEDADGGLLAISAVAVASDDTVWFGGDAIVVGGPFPFTSVTIVRSATADGGGPVEYRRDVNAPGQRATATAVDDLRPYGDGRVAMAHRQGCCQRIDGIVPLDDVTIATFPRTHLPPTCSVDDLQVVDADHEQLTVRFTPCIEAVERRQPTEYRVQVLALGVPATSVVVADGPVGPLEATIPATAAELSFVSIVARNPGGDGPEAYPAATTIAPFTSLPVAVAFLHRDLLGRVDLAAVAADADDLRFARTTLPELLDRLVQQGRSANVVEPIARLYRAAFLRDADPSGLRYWIARRDAGERLARVGEQFARSPELQRRYGSLTDREFVAQVYRNVLGREADPGGLDFWARRLEARRLGRGDVLVQFSESPEHLRRTDPTIEPLAAAWLLLGRRPTALERTAWEQPTTPGAAAARRILATSEYADRVDG